MTLSIGMATTLLKEITKNPRHYDSDMIVFSDDVEKAVDEFLAENIADDVTLTELSKTIKQYLYHHTYCNYASTTKHYLIVGELEEYFINFVTTTKEYNYYRDNVKENNVYTY